MRGFSLFRGIMVLATAAVMVLGLPVGAAQGADFGYEVEPTIEVERAPVAYRPIEPITIGGRTIVPDPRAIESGLYIRPRQAVGETAVAFTVAEPDGVNRQRYPVRGGIPIFRGELEDATRVRLTDEAGNEVPAQGMATAVWPEGTVRFLCIDFLTDLEPGQTRQFVLRYGTEIEPTTNSSLQVEQRDGAVHVDTGRLSVSFRPGETFSSDVRVDGRQVTRAPLSGRLLVSEGEPLDDPVEYPLIIDEVEIIEAGPVQTTVYLGGRYGDQETRSALRQQQGFPRYVFHGFVRLYADSARMDVIHSFGYNGDEYQDFVRRYGLTVPLDASGGRFVYGADQGEPAEAAMGDLRLAQPSHSAWALTGSSEAAGHRFGGWASVRNGDRSVVMGLREAWQQWPVSFKAGADGDLTLDMHGGDDESFLDLRYKDEGVEVNWETGEGTHLSHSMYIGERLSRVYGVPQYRAMGLLKISELVIDFTPEAAPAEVGNGQHKMLVPWPGMKRFAETRVFGLTGHYDRSNPQHQRAIDYYSIVLDFPYAAHEANGLYGWVDWNDPPDFLPPREGEDRFDTSRFGGGEGWTNGERIVMGYFGHYMSSGWRRAFDTGHMMTLHTIGIDIEHPGGDQNTGMAHRHNQVHWGSGGGPRQASWRGWYYHYWLTGHPEVKRSLRALHPVILGAHETPQAAQWPHVDAWNPPGYGDEFRQIGLRDGLEWARVWNSNGTPFHYMNFLRWTTTGETEFVLVTDSVMQAWGRNYYVESEDGGRNAPNLIFVRLSDGELIGLDEREMQPDLPNADDPPAPHFTGYYFTTYGGVSLMSEWAQLTGSSHAVDAITLIGDYYATEARGHERVDIRNSNDREGPPWQPFGAREGLVPAYTLLRQNEHTHRADRWASGMRWRLFEANWGSPRRLAEGARPLKDPYEYTAQGYADTNVRVYGRNGPKIYGAMPMTNLYTLWFDQPGGPPELAD